MSNAFYRYVYNRENVFKKNKTIPIATSPSLKDIEPCLVEWNKYLYRQNRNQQITTNYNLNSNIISTQDPSINNLASNPIYRGHCRVVNNEMNRKATSNSNSNIMSTNMRISNILKYQQTQVPNIFAIY